MPTASAKPGALLHYADLETQSSAALMPQADHVSTALSQFLATCTEFRVASVSLDLVDQLRVHSANTYSLGDWVGLVGLDFLEADSRNGYRPPGFIGPVAYGTTSAYPARSIGPFAVPGPGAPAAPDFIDGTYDPFSPWATAPFAAGAAVLGPGPVPIFGPGGRIPAGYTNPGSRLWLYIGGSGPDTLFSVHPHAGWTRAPYKLPKPNLRFDYGPINTDSGTAYLLNGKKVPVPPNPQIFHWNNKGGMGQINQPLWRTWGGYVTHDHQLMGNGMPRSNVAGPISGGTFIKGATRTLFWTGAAIDTYNIATAEDKPREVVKTAAGWGGAWVGAKGGAAIGAGIGSFFGPGPGTAVGGFFGGLIGGIGGYWAGSNLGEQGYDAVTK